MPTLKQKDPTFFMKDATLCQRLKGEDLFGTGDLVERFYRHLLHDENTLYESSIFAILAPTGSGKTFFLAMLYCLLQEKDHTVRYINVLDYIVEENTDEIISDIKRGCTTTDVSIVLIDNIEKHSPQFIVDFIYRLDKIIQSNKILAVLAYDDTVVQQKLLELYQSGNDTEEFFQRFIDIEFFLNIYTNSGKLNINYPTTISSLYTGMINSFFNEIIDSNLLSLLKVMLLKKKLEFALKKITENTDANFNYMPEITTICFLIFFKLYDKKNYKKIQQNNYTDKTQLKKDIEDSGSKCISLFDMAQKALDNISNEMTGYTNLPSINDTIKLLELHNV